MSKVLKIAGEVIVGAARIAVTAGAGAALIGGVGLSSAVALGAAAVGSIGLSLGTIVAIGAGLTLAGGLLAKKPSVSPAQEQRTKVSLELSAPRKIVFGHTALGTDLRYQELWGAQQEYVTQILLVASHWCEAIDEVWINDQLGWSAGGGTDAAFTNYFFVSTRPQAAPGNPYLPGWTNRWGDNACFTGCATLLLTWRVQGYGSKATSPFASSIPTRITVRGRAARVYDPRQDSTVGGVGEMRASDQSTWAFAPGGVEIGRNPALCLLFYLLGWRIQNPATGVWKLAVGLGVPVDRIDLASFITAANFCDETVSLAAGGSEPRYRCDGMFSEADDPISVITALEACMNGKVRDSAGRFSLQIFHNDLGTPVLDLTADDLLDDFTWDAGGALNELKNVIKGRYVDPSNASLYQMVDAPAVKLPSLDGIDRIEQFDLALVQSPSQAQRLRKARLQRYQYPGTFAGNFKARAWALKDGDVVRFTLPALGFAQKLFRVTKATVQVSGVVPLVLAEEAAVIYSWDQEEAPAVVAAEPIRFDPINEPIRLAIDDAAETAAWEQVHGAGKPDDNATVGAPAGTTVGGAATVVARTWDDSATWHDTDLWQDTQTVVTGGMPAEQVVVHVSDLLESVDLLATLPDQVSAIEEVGLNSAAADRQRDRDLAQLGITLGRLLIQVNGTMTAIRDAGINVDPTTGTVRLFTLDEAVDHLNDLQVTLDAQAAKITLAATRTYVAEQIALAQIDPGQVADLTSLIARVSQAEVDIDALQGAITLKASSTDLDTLGIRVSDVEQALLAVGDTTSITTTVRQARYTADLAGQNALAAILAGDIANRANLSALAQATQQLTTTITGNTAAEAAERLTLAVQIAQSAAAILQEATTRADAISAEARSREALEAVITDPATGNVALDARVTGERQARVDGDKAQADTSNAITARLDNAGGNGTSVEAAISANRSAIAAVAGTVATTDALDEAISTVNGNIASAVHDEQTRADQAYASVSTASEISARLDDVGGGQSLEATVTRLDEVTADNTGKLMARMQEVAGIGGTVAGIRALVETGNGTTTSDLALIAKKQGFWLQLDDGTLIQAIALGTVNGEPVSQFFGKLLADSVDARELVNSAVQQITYSVLQNTITIPAGS